MRNNFDHTYLLVPAVFNLKEGTLAVSLPIYALDSDNGWSNLLKLSRDLQASVLYLPIYFRPGNFSISASMIFSLLLL